MKDAILDFIEGLKLRGVRVSLSEAMDALRGITEVGLSEKSIFKSTLRSTLVKDNRDIPVFEELFDIYFSPHLVIETALEAESAKIKQISSFISEFKDTFSEEFVGMMQGDPKMIMEMVMMAAREAQLEDIRFPIQSGYYFTRMSGMMSGWGLERQLNEFIDLLRGQGQLENGIGEGDVRELFNRRMEQIRELMRDTIRREEQKHRGEKKELDIPDRLGERNFSELTEKEIEEMRDVVKELVKKIKDVLSLRDRRVRRGRFDIKRTLRLSQQYGGVPIKVLFKKRRKKKVQIVTLCDVSRSVWNASRFMLNLLYSLQDQFDRVRSFVFVSDLGEVTDCFNRYEINDAIGRLMFEAGINFYSYTDYGEVLLRFYKDYLDIVNRRTTIIIIGDARNNYMAHNSWALEKIKAKARKVYWLNPEPEGWWGSGDSDMHEFIPFVTEARECRNLKQLARFIRDLIT
jgi:uncharacterized protein with von Willebrand factor type A (vWA) domain